VVGVVRKDVLTQLGMTEAEKSAFEKILRQPRVNISGNGPPVPMP